MKDRLKQIRKDAGLTQQEFADKLGISKQNVINYESRGTAPSQSGIQIICRTFNINEHWLLTGEGEMKAPASRESEIADITALLYNEPEDSFRSKLIKLAANLTDDQLETAKQMLMTLLK